MRMRPGRRIARVAVGSAVAGATMGAVNHHQQKRWASKDQEAYQEAATQQQLAAQQAQLEQLQEQQQAAPPAPQYAQEQYAPAPQYASAAPVAAAAPSYIEELQHLATLRDQGIISAEDFEAKKKQLLGI